MGSKRFEDEFTVHVISSASMEIFDQNTLASFRNFFNDEIQLSGDWRVALSEIIFPTKIQHVVNGDLIAYSLKGYEESQRISSDANVISRPYSGEKFSFMTGNFETVAQLLFTIKRTVGLPNFSFHEIKSTGKYEILFGKNEGITFPSEEIPSIVGFTGIPDKHGVHIGYKMNTATSNKLMKSDETKAFYGEFPADLCAGKHLIFIYTNIIEYQYVGDAKAPLLPVIDSKQRLKNGSVCELESTHRTVFSNLDYKKLLSNTIQSISIELRTEKGQLVPFSGTGKVILTLQFKKFGD